MNIFKHMIENPFITGAGIAALSHSTWSLGTLFSGTMPIVTLDNPVTLAMWLYWFLPAFLIAFALDIGQINTSHKIRHYGLSWQRGVTFLVFSVATYYLQFLFIAHHMPDLAIESGISQAHIQNVTWLRDMAIWFLPSILPLATLLYTLSDDTTDVTIKNEYVDYNDYEINIKSLDDTSDALPMMDDDTNLLPEAGHVADCPECVFYRDGYKTEIDARRAIAMHKCKPEGDYQDVQS